MNATLIEARLSLNVSHSKRYKYADTRGRHVTLPGIFTLQKQLINTVHLLSTSASFTFPPRYSRFVSRIKLLFFYLYLLFFTQSYRWRRRGEEGSGKKLQKKIVPQFFSRPSRPLSCCHRAFFLPSHSHQRDVSLLLHSSDTPSGRLRSSRGAPESSYTRGDEASGPEVVWFHFKINAQQSQCRALS